MAKKLTHKEFVLDAIRALHNPKYSHKGIHVVFSGFNNAFREYFGEEPRPIIDRLTAEGIIEKRLVKGGVLIYVAGEAPEHISPKKKKQKGALDKILNSR